MNFQEYCDEPAFPVREYVFRKGITRLEYCVMEIMKIKRFELDPEVTAEARRVRMLQVLYNAEDMLRVVYEHCTPDSETVKHPAL